jgi:CheY-like chemotaxis protein
MAGGGQLLVETGGVILEEEYIREHQYMEKGRYALLVVSDTGIGMDEATRERAFEPFFTTKAPGKGTGLGLSVVYGIVKRHSGSIHLYSEPGKGSTIKIYFPAIVVAPDVRMPAVGPIRGGSETILLAEDEESIRTLAERILKDIGYTVFTARNGEDAIEVFRRHREKIVLAVLDVVMPRIGGKEVFEVMRNENPGLKAIFMSGYSMNAIHEAFVIHPDTPFLGKPFVPSVLARKVREVLDG